MVDDKTCTRCKRLLPADKFGWRTQPNGKCYAKPQCKKCESEARRIARSTPRPPRVEPTSKQCAKCVQTLPIDEFYVNGHTASGYALRFTMCRKCYNAGRRGKRPRRQRKVCNICGVRRSLTKFTDSSSDKCQVCIDAENTVPRGDDRADAEYDYRFARTVLGLSKYDAIDWLIRGYKDQDEASVYEWGFHLEDTEIEWEPDAPPDEDVFASAA